MKATEISTSILDINDKKESAFETDTIDISSSDSLIDIRFELGLWLTGLEIFCSIGRNIFRYDAQSARPDRNYLFEFHLCRSVLTRCCGLSAKLQESTPNNSSAIESEMAEIDIILRRFLALNITLCKIDDLNFAEWNAWREVVADELRRTAIYSGFIADLEFIAEKYTPEKLKRVLNDTSLPSADRRELRRFVPKLVGLSRSLSVVGEMLENDEPLRSSLAVFAFVFEATNELINEINESLTHFEDETAEVFGMLDASSYTLSIELRKAISQELAEILELRSATAVYARVEAAYGILNDSIRQLLAGFAKLSEPGIAAIDIFPDFHTKLLQSLELRNRLWRILELIRKTERELSPESIATLHNELERFLNEPVSYLFYKDRETFERFCREVEMSADRSEAAPVLHRFSAYVETLFSLVALRSVLANHPFEHSV